MNTHKTATCHPDRKHHAKGLCRSCYIYSRVKKRTKKAECHTEKPHYAQGLCYQCYMRDVIMPKRNGAKEPPKASCHPNLVHWRDGLCVQCWIDSPSNTENEQNKKDFFKKHINFSQNET